MTKIIDGQVSSTISLGVGVGVCVCVWGGAGGGGGRAPPPPPSRVLNLADVENESEISEIKHATGRSKVPPPAHKTILSSSIYCEISYVYLTPLNTVFATSPSSSKSC
jgi:hypothetical protein